MLRHMQAATPIPPLRDIVLVGGGHSHVQVLKSFGMHPEPGVRLTLITPTLETPYSGMLPGHVAGAYSADDIHIHLLPLSRFAGARLIQAQACGIDLENSQLQLPGRPPVTYDVLSINCGATPVAPQPDAVTVKPISTFLPKWTTLRRSVSREDVVLFVGGGAGSVELAMAARASLPPCKILLVGEVLMPGHGDRARRQVESHLARLDIGWQVGRVQVESETGVELFDGGHIEADHVLWVTQVQAPAWLAQSGLHVDERGFVLVDEHLRSLSHSNVFAAGDAAHLHTQDRPKSGVYAVRAGPVLTQNLRRVVTDKPLQRFRAQRNHLALLGTGDGQAIASRGRFAFSGPIWWRLKQSIDLNFMKKFNNLPEMSQVDSYVDPALKADMPEQAMRCGGCGAKIAADPLRRVLHRLPKQRSESVLLGIGDDAALIRNQGEELLLSVDGFRAIVDDAYLFGRIAAHHALNDIFAMGALPNAALALVTIPLMSDKLMEEELFQLLSGIVNVLNEQDTPLVGGHSAEGAELSVGLTVTGEPGERALHKRGARTGDRLIITKPLGTGVIMAGAMQGRCASEPLQAALAQMDLSNGPALEVFLNANAQALTDVTGFGLAGHLSEMLRASGCGVRVSLSDIPVLPGAVDMLDELHSSLQGSNELALSDYTLGAGVLQTHAKLRIMADPQTSGGLLASVPPSQAAVSLQRLIELGYQAADIGEVRGDEFWRISR